jgi:hypothetical protein
MFFADVDPPARYFTPEEANGLLPRVRALMSKAAEHQRRLHERLQREPGQTSRKPTREIEEHESGARECIDELEALGVHVKGIESGLVDFPALRNGEYVYLCWRAGEPRVEWWHGLTAGFAGRQRITKDAAVRWEWRN